MSRKSELRRLRCDLQQLDAEIAEQFRELSAFGRNLTGIDDELARAAERRQRTGEQLSEARLELASQDREVAPPDGVGIVLEPTRSRDGDTVLGASLGEEAAIGRAQDSLGAVGPDVDAHHSVHLTAASRRLGLSDWLAQAPQRGVHHVCL